MTFDIFNFLQIPHKIAYVSLKFKEPHLKKVFISPKLFWQFSLQTLDVLIFVEGKMLKMYFQIINIVQCMLAKISDRETEGNKAD